MKYSGMRRGLVWGSMHAGVVISPAVLSAVRDALDVLEVQPAALRLDILDLLGFHGAAVDGIESGEIGIQSRYDHSERVKDAEAVLQCRMHRYITPGAPLH